MVRDTKQFRSKLIKKEADPSSGAPLPRVCTKLLSFDGLLTGEKRVLRYTKFKKPQIPTLVDDPKIKNFFGVLKRLSLDTNIVLIIKYLGVFHGFYLFVSLSRILSLPWLKNTMP